MTEKIFLRVCMLIDAWEPFIGGGQIHAKKLSEYLIKCQNVEIDIFTRALKNDLGEKIKNNEIDLDKKRRVFRLGKAGNVLSFVSRILWCFSVYWRVKKEHKKKPYDLIHAHAFVGGIPGKFLSKILKIPIIFTVHGTTLTLVLKKKGLFYFIEKFLLTKIAYTKVISVASNYLQLKNVNKNVEIIPNGVETEKFDEVNVKKSENNFRVLFVGRFDKVKGLNVLMEAISVLFENNKNLLNEKNFKLVIIGYGDEEKPLKNLVDNFKLGELIEFKGKIIGEELIKEYKKSDIFILPSLSEGNPLTLFESFAAKVPVLATDVGDNKKYIKENVNGFICDPNDVKSLVLTLTKALNCEKLKVMGENGYNMVKNNFSWEKTANLTYNVYLK
ncbi:hypothetical protein A2229_05135, partial [Candidatus Peregrinibacteria bacterium RIFOXYA2_FULL_33_7]